MIGGATVRHHHRRLQAGRRSLSRLDGIALSTGAACHSGSTEPSPVLLAMGVPEALARAALRFSLGPVTTRAEIERVLEVLPAVVARVRRARAA